MGVMASGGSGREISTFEAEERSLNWLRAFTKYSVRLRLCFSTAHSTQISGRTFWLSRYVLHRGPRVMTACFPPAAHFGAGLHDPQRSPASTDGLVDCASKSG